MPAPGRCGAPPRACGAHGTYPARQDEPDARPARRSGQHLPSRWTSRCASTAPIGQGPSGPGAEPPRCAPRRPGGRRRQREARRTRRTGDCRRSGTYLADWSPVTSQEEAAVVWDLLTSVLRTARTPPGYAPPSPETTGGSFSPTRRRRNALPPSSQCRKDALPARTGRSR